jgi:hypothetical protein
VTRPNCALRGALLMAFLNAEGFIHVYLDQMAMGNSHCCSMTSQHLREAIWMKSHSLHPKIVKPFHDGASLGAAYVKSSSCSIYSGNALPIHNTAWSLCLMNILGSLNKCFERKHLGMKVAEISDLWELHNKSIVWAISHLCHDYVDTSNMRVQHTLRYYFQNTPSICDMCWWLFLGVSVFLFGHFSCVNKIYQWLCNTEEEAASCCRN